MKKTDRYILLVMLTASLAVLFLHFSRNTDKGTSLCINEIMGRSSEYMVDYTTYSKQWVELYNGTEQDIDLTGYGLSTLKGRLYQLQFNQVTIPARGYLVILALGPDGPETPCLSDDNELRTNFSINPNGGCLVLTDDEGQTVDSMFYGNCIADVAYGRSPDGGEFVLFKQSSRGDPNEINISRTLNSDTYTQEVAFSHEEGYYPEEFYLELSASPEESIFYTLDGSEPDIYSKVYKSPLRINDRSNEENRYATISTVAGDVRKKYGEKPVKKAVVVRARAFKDGCFSEKIVSKTYWIGEPAELLTISLVTDPGNLFDYKDGIMVPGLMYSYYIRGRNEVNPQVGNYSLRGGMSVREASISFFESGRPVAQHNGGVRVGAGLINAARGPVKRLYLSSSSLYELDGSLFPMELIPGNELAGEGYTELKLRNSLNFVENALTDTFANRLIKGAGLGEQEERPVSVYIDGEYWGVSYLTETIDEEFVTRHFQLENNNISLLTLDSRTQIYEIEAGDKEMREDYLGLLQYAMEHDMKEQENYAYLDQRLDIDNYIKNYIIRMFLVCTDWPDNNIRVFRAINSDGSTYGDEKWRYIMFDNDYAALDYQYDMFTYVMGEDKRQGRYDNQRPAAGSYEMFGRLMENKDFRERFRKQYEEYKETIFDRDHMETVLEETLEELGGEFEGNASRWSSTPSLIGKVLGLFGMNSGTVDQMQVEQNSLDQMREFIRQRETYMDQHMEAMFARYEN